jgi:CRISPR-associated endonuclease Csn1
MNLQLPKYRDAGLTEYVEFEKDGQIHKTEVIKDWTKRKDHRHHAIDALAIACTKQSIIQKINTLSSQETRDAMYNEVSDLNKNSYRRKSLLEAYVFKQRPFTTREVAGATASILVSFKSGKKVATIGQRKISQGGRKTIVQQGIVVPRGPLSEETVYGRIKLLTPAQPLKVLFENPDRIVKARIRQLVKDRIEAYQGDQKLALASLRKKPIWLDTEETVPLIHGSIYLDHFVVKYPVEQIRLKDLDSILDIRVRQRISERLRKFDGNEKQAFKNLEAEPIWYNEEKRIPLRSVRCLTGLESVEPLKAGNLGTKVGFVKPGNNHHIAIYEDLQGNMVEHICTFWHAVERVKYRIPVVIGNPDQIWDLILAEKMEYPDSFLSKLPEAGLSLKFSMQQNEMFILGLPPETVASALEQMDLKMLSEFLYRVQKLGENYYVFRHHLETEIDDTIAAMNSKRFARIQSLSALIKAFPVKVKVNRLGGIQKFV